MRRVVNGNTLKFLDANGTQLLNLPKKRQITAYV